MTTSTTTYTYEILNLLTIDQLPDRPKTVRRVISQITATRSQEQKTSGVYAFELTDGETFIPFENLTEQQVKIWVDERPEWGIYKQQLDIILDKQMEPPMLIQFPPWLPTENETVIMVSTTSTNSESSTATVTASVQFNPTNPNNQINEEYLKALIYEVLTEINEESI